MNTPVKRLAWVGCLLGFLAVCLPALHGQQTRREEVADAMRQRPTDPWPRGDGRVILAPGGSYLVNKSYHEPGGSFSPEFGSFGISLWLQDKSGVVKVTSDSLPMDQVIQRLFYGDARTGPGIVTDTPYYSAIWSLGGPGTWKLDLQVKTNAGLKPVLVVRGVGPAAGPVLGLSWSANILTINRRWNVRPMPAPEACYLVSEGSTNWLTTIIATNSLNDAQGWGCARMELADGKRYSITIRDFVSPPAPLLAVSSLRSPLELSLPDTNFVACLHAQVAHLIMGLNGREPRACEPAQAAQLWMRDAAQTAVALAQAGQVELARQLCVQLAEQDFLGGFGPEADNPGLALWAIGEVCLRLQLPAFDELLFPHVVRKARLIMEMRTTDKALTRTPTAPVSPAHAHHPDLSLLCDPSRDGMIHGKVAWERPSFYVNAVSFRGLLAAAVMADRMKDTLNAGLWRSHAADLRREWLRMYPNGDSTSAFTTQFALWPAQILNDRTAYTKALQTRWGETRDSRGSFRAFPAHGSQDLAEAHQWLYLNQVERVWSTLVGFWEKQTSPGLYTWGEDPSPYTVSAAWSQVRAGATPSQVSPHYGIAAQMLMLQIEMLAAMDESGSEPTLVIGPGVPVNWVDYPMLVRGLITPFGRVDWQWGGNVMQVALNGFRCRVVLGSAFPANATLRVNQ